MKRTCTCTRPLCALLALLLFLPSCGVHEADTSVIYITTCQDLPDTKERLFSMYGDIVVVTIIKTKEKYNRKADEYTNYHLLSTCKVERVIRGNIQIGENITVSQLGNNRTLIYRTVEESGGYLQEGQRWMLILHKNHTNPKNPYPIVLDVGQYALDENDHITFMTDTSRSLLGDIQSVDDMEAVWQEYAAENP